MDEVLRRVNYKDILEYSGSFLSLDISKNSLGWVLYIDNVLSYGAYAVKGDTVTELKYDFRNFLLTLLEGKTLEKIYVEDTIMGNNYKTTNVLVSLNTVPDDLVYEGAVVAGEVIRIGNTQWKKYLRLLLGYRPSISGLKTKEQILEMMHLLGFNEDVEQDVYDALGIAVGCIANEKVLQVNKPAKVKSDILKGYHIKQCFSDAEQSRKLDAVQKRRGKSAEQIKSIRNEDIKKDLRATFKQLVREFGDECIFDIQIDPSLMGCVLLLGGLKPILEGCDCVHLVVYKK